MTVQITKTSEETRRAFAKAKAGGLSVGLVPTMGALHAGHASLFQAARLENGFVVASIFVNPAQFGPNEDLERYPRPFARDVEICEAEGVDLIFHPEASAMYPAGFQTYVEVSEFQKRLCGITRPTHFRGVATVVLKLFNIVQPEVAYFGQKDAQQARLLQQMARDLDVPIRVAICPTVREPDGLALSSRNQYLDATQRKHATVLQRVLQVIEARVKVGERRTEPLLNFAMESVEATPGARLDYAEAVAWDTLLPAANVEKCTLFALAVFFGTTRLIDNVMIQI